MNINIPFNIGVYGKSESGKTTLIKHLILQNYNKFDYIVIISGTALYNKNYDFMKDLGIKYRITEPYDLSEKLEAIVDTAKKCKLSNIVYNTLIVFDDIIGLFKNSGMSKFLNGCYRHFEISLFFVFQVITACHTDTRSNHNKIFLFEMDDDRCFEHCKKSFMPYFSFDKLKEYLEGGFRAPHVFLHIDRIKKIREFCKLSAF